MTRSRRQILGGVVSDSLLRLVLAEMIDKMAAIVKVDEELAARSRAGRKRRRGVDVGIFKVAKRARAGGGESAARRPPRAPGSSRPPRPPSVKS